VAYRGGGLDVMMEDRLLELRQHEVERSLPIDQILKPDLVDEGKLSIDQKTFEIVKNDVVRLFEPRALRAAPGSFLSNSPSLILISSQSIIE
jgi:hypothetical protein